MMAKMLYSSCALTEAGRSMAKSAISNNFLSIGSVLLLFKYKGNYRVFQLV